MTAPITDMAAESGPDLVSVSRLPQRDSLTAMSATTTDTAADHGAELVPFARPALRDFLKA
jgi:hypothetical protein